MSLDKIIFQTDMEGETWFMFFFFFLYFKFIKRKHFCVTKEYLCYAKILSQVLKVFRNIFLPLLKLINSLISHFIPPINKPFFFSFHLYPSFFCLPRFFYCQMRQHRYNRLSNKTLLHNFITIYTS